MINSMNLTFSAIPENEALARTAISAFILPLNPTIEELADIKTAVSEAVTNSIIHGYLAQHGEVLLHAQIGADGRLQLEIRDHGVGIEDIALAMQPFYTSDCANERSGMGFTVMQSFMDSVEVISSPQTGTTVRMTKQMRSSQELPAQLA